MMHPQDPMSVLFALRAQGDADAAHAAFRIDKFLTEPEQEFSDPSLNERVTRCLSTGPSGDAGPGPIPRTAFEAGLS